MLLKTKDDINEHIGCQTSSVPTSVITIMENRVPCDNLNVSVSIVAIALYCQKYSKENNLVLVLYNYII